MGLTYHEVKHLLEARSRGVSFERTLMLSHQQLYIHPSELRALRSQLKGTEDAAVRRLLADYKFGEYADRFCREFLGATSLDSLDFSPYEGATIIHDMNTPIPEHLRMRFDAVIESGSLEHIFNFPVAIANLMRMLKTGGTAFITMVANNLCGHGFYQFSPELAYRVFSPENGFELNRVVFLEAKFPAIELVPIRSGFQVADPLRVGSRVSLLSKRPIMMMLHATKVQDKIPFTSVPQQSDYVAMWNDNARRQFQGIFRRIAKKLPTALRNQIHGYYLKRIYSLQNRAFYRRLT